MFAVLVVVAVVCVLAGAALAAASRSRRFDEVERFHHARRMTTEWAKQGVTTPLVTEPDESEDRSRA